MTFSLDCVWSSWNKTEIQRLAAQNIISFKSPACKSSRFLHAFNTSVRLRKLAPALAVANSTIAGWSCGYASFNGGRPDEACVNFLSFEALEVLWLDISEMTFFFSARRFGCLWASEINAFSFCFFYFNWSRASFKCLTFSVVTNPNSFKEVKVVILDSILTISAWSSSCFGVSRARVWSFDCWLSICQSTPAVWWSFEDGLSRELAEFGCVSSWGSGCVDSKHKDFCSKLSFYKNIALKEN